MSKKVLFVAFAVFTLSVPAVTVSNVDSLIKAVEDQERWIDIRPGVYDLTDREPMVASDDTRAYLVINHLCTFKGAWSTEHWSRQSQEVVIKGGDAARLVYCCLEGRQTRFQSITFEGGDAGVGNGGAILFNSVGTGFATNCVFRGAKAKSGGALYSVSAYDCCFTNCSATSSGGGVYCANAGDKYVGCYFIEDHANVGGGCACHAFSKSVSGCVFTNCTATTNGGGMYSGTIDELADVDFFGNSAGDKGGNLHVGTLNVATNCTFKDGVSDTTYGGVYLNSYGGTFYKCVFDNNTNKVAGTVGTHVNNARTVSDCTFRGWGDVRAQFYERCIFDRCRYFASESSYADGMLTFVSYREAGAIRNCLFDGCETSVLVLNQSNKNLPIYNCTFVDNRLRHWGNHVGATFWAYRADENKPSTNVVVNCVFSGNKIATQSSVASGVYYDSDFVSRATTYKVESCPCLNIVSNSAYVAYDPAYNTDNAPQLASVRHVSDMKFNGLSSPDEPYWSLTLESPVINRGVPLEWTAADKDLAGNSRFVGGGVDMGCYECQRIRSFLVIFR